MHNFVRARSASLSTVLLVLMLIALMQGSISYSITFGGLDRYVPDMRGNPAAVGWIGLRLLLLTAVLAMWLLNRRTRLFQAIIVANAVFTVGLLVNMVALLLVLAGYSSQKVTALVVDVLLMAVTNIMIFSIWYWIIDPPGVEESQREDVAWDFRFPQRSISLPNYEIWVPRYTDYAYVAFTTSFAFSPTDTMPLTRRAKLLMLLQATISLVTVTVIAGSAINILAGTR